MTEYEKIIDDVWPKSASSSVLPFESWERLPGETGAAHSAFCIFRDFGPERNIRKAVEAGHEGRTETVISKRYRLWRQWSMKFQWVKRAADYDQYIEKLKQAEMRKTIEAQGQAHREITGKMLQVVGKKLDTMNPEELSQNNVTEWVSTAIRTEREIAGLVSSNVNSETKQGEFNFTSDFQGL